VPPACHKERAPAVSSGQPRSLGEGSWTGLTASDLGLGRRPKLHGMQALTWLGIGVSHGTRVLLLDFGARQFVDAKQHPAGAMQRIRMPDQPRQMAPRTASDSSSDSNTGGWWRSTAGSWVEGA
jgi:hypothetical protein